MIKPQEMLQEFGNAFAFIALAAALPPIILWVSSYFRPSFPYSGKLESYECGEQPIGSAYVMFNNRFYLVAIVFLVFDVEVALLFPVLQLFRSSIEAASPMAIQIFTLSFLFIGILFLGLIYELKKKDIDWIKDSADRTDAFKQTEHYKGRTYQ